VSAIKALILTAALAWLAKLMVDAGRDVRNGNLVLHVRVGWLALSGFCILTTFFLLIWAWRYIAAELSGTRLPYLTSARIWFISNLGSQLPGRVWGIIQMGAMSAEAGLNPVSAGAAAIINTVVNLATGMAVGVLAGTSILVAVAGAYAKWAWVLAILALAGVLALPVLVPWALRVARRKLGDRIPEQQVPPRVIAVSGAINILAWGMYGIAFLFLNRGLVDLPSYGVMQHIAVNAASYVIGYLVLVVPAGLGFREAALKTAMVAAGMASAEQAGAVSVISRFWQLIILILPALIFLAYRRPPNEKDSAAGQA
jgi:hypothetical protein